MTTTSQGIRTLGRTPGGSNLSVPIRSTWVEKWRGSFPEGIAIPRKRAAGQTDGRGPRHVKVSLGWLALGVGDGAENLFSTQGDPVLIAENEVLPIIYVIFIGKLILS